ncbi:hypothetical protein FB565_000251 [Actinoplanes lutulentus]|uniref:Uncharacterized protein n=1 Tax=Actinoplanes lutulentus TaxID=1287878 RepID=A0A327YUZ9_9ACTN|nr:hypothetical protein [Actinoplanes lutulentus]MBB2940547.1 hypothetical protein [Actinoplanes lutulentus]RAK24817.1 hypothetical protein B0I29_13523 [Actinoplanes lutulentus]
MSRRNPRHARRAAVTRTTAGRTGRFQGRTHLDSIEALDSGMLALMIGRTR